MVTGLPSPGCCKFWRVKLVAAAGNDVNGSFGSPGVESDRNETWPSPNRNWTPPVCKLLYASRSFVPVPEFGGVAEFFWLRRGPGRPSKLPEVTLDRTHTAAMLLV